MVRPSAAARTSSRPPGRAAGGAERWRRPRRRRWAGSWWNRARRRARPARRLHRVVGGAVAPVRLRPNSAGQYWASWIRRSTPVAQLEHGVGDDALAAACGRLVVADVGDRRRRPVDAVAVGRADVRDRPHGDLGAADGELVVGDVVEADVARQLVEPHREVRRADELVERLVERAVLLRRPVDVEPGAGPRTGTKNGRPWTWSQWRWVTRAVPRKVPSWGWVWPEEAQAGAEVEDDRLLAGGLQRRRTRCCRRSGWFASHAHGVDPRTPQNVTRTPWSPSPSEQRIIRPDRLRQPQVTVVTNGEPVGDQPVDDPRRPRRVVGPTGRRRQPIEGHRAGAAGRRRAGPGPAGRSRRRRTGDR